MPREPQARATAWFRDGPPGLLNHRVGLVEATAIRAAWFRDGPPGLLNHRVAEDAAG